MSQQPVHLLKQQPNRIKPRPPAITQATALTVTFKSSSRHMYGTFLRWILILPWYNYCGLNWCLYNHRSSAESRKSPLSHNWHKHIGASVIPRHLNKQVADLHFQRDCDPKADRYSRTCIIGFWTGELFNKQLCICFSNDSKWDLFLGRIAASVDGIAA